jgi:hypothetical protein
VVAARRCGNTAYSNRHCVADDNLYTHAWHKCYTNRDGNGFGNRYGCPYNHLQRHAIPDGHAASDGDACTDPDIHADRNCIAHLDSDIHTAPDGYTVGNTAFVHAAPGAANATAG